VDAGKIYIYHNTFWGGLDGEAPVFSVLTYYKRFRMPMPFYILNNIYKDNHRLYTTHYDLTGPNLLYVFDSKKVYKNERRDPEVPKFNKIVNEEDTKRIWNHNDIPGLPDMTLAPDSPALEAGVDISKPFSINGKEYPALRGFKPGYFKGKAPAAGAFQLGESQEHFNEMFRRSEKIARKLKELRERTAAEARQKAAGK